MMLRQIWIDLRVRLTSLFGRRDLHARAREEMEFHLAMRERRLMDLGLPASEARLQARREFGNPSLLQENTIESWRYAALERLLLDMRYAMRRLAKSPGFTLAAAVTLGLGIGANVAIFTLLYQVLIKPFPYPNAEQLVVLWDTSGQFAKSEVTPADFRDWRQQATVFSEMAAYSYLDNVPLRSIDGAELIAVQRVDENFFKVLGVSPLRGRWFDAQEAQSGSPLVAVISLGFWQRHFSGSENLTGAEVGGYRVVGVMPPGFLFGERNTDLWIPLVISEREWTSRTNDILLVVGRLKPGVSITQANTEMDRITGALARAYPATNTNRQALLFPLREEFAGSVRTIYFVLFAASGCVLLVACLNVAHLLLLRGARRQRELAVRASLGASRARLTQQLLTESALLAFGGGLIGLIISQWNFQFLRHADSIGYGRHRIVGIVGDVKQRRLDIAAEPELMVPYLQDSGFYRPRNLILRTTVDPASLVEVVRREVLAVDSVCRSP